MIGKREIRMALTGALLFLAIGSLQACASDITGAQVDGREGDADVCYWVGSVLQCN